ncbi:MAG: hypothetical protein BKP49_00550 [Treponema sp. CETP13]|nr:MAG: hypothetical protein BKP49_00550 [Treponema sp. CETP13]
MKRCSLNFACFALVFCLVVPAFADSSSQSKSVETVIIDNFDDPNAVEWSWGLIASRFIEDDFPKYGYVKGLPNSLRQVATKDVSNAQVFGIQTSFTRKGDNWVEIFPQKENADGELVSYEIPLIGSVTQTDFWVWGSNYEYYLDLLFRDTDGRVITLTGTCLNFHGWQNVIVEIPGWVKQKSSLRSGPDHLSFVGFHVRTDPSAPVDDFMLYLDNFRYTTNTYPDVYDGYSLRQTDFDSLNSVNGTEGDNGQ